MTPRSYAPDCALDPGAITLALPCPWCGATQLRFEGEMFGKNADQGSIGSQAVCEECAGHAYVWACLHNGRVRVGVQEGGLSPTNVYGRPQVIPLAVIEAETVMKGK